MEATRYVEKIILLLFCSMLICSVDAEDTSNLQNTGFYVGFALVKSHINIVNSNRVSSETGPSGGTFPQEDTTSSYNPGFTPQLQAGYIGSLRSGYRWGVASALDYQHGFQKLGDFHGNLYGLAPIVKVDPEKN